MSREDMTDLNEALPWDYEVSIEDDGDNNYSLFVGGSKVVFIGPTYANPLHRDIHFSIYGPCNIDRSVAIMKGFLHLTALLGNEDRASASRPAILENDSKPPEGTKKWQTPKTTRKFKRS